MEKTTHNVARAVVVGVFVCAAALIFFFDPARSSVFPPCPFHALTGWWCPGCGSTRALHQLLHGHFAEAFRYNPLAILAIPFLLIAAVIPFWRKRAVLAPVWSWTALVLIIGFGILRNLPWQYVAVLKP